MARCYKCQKKLGLFEKDKDFRMVEGKRFPFCGSCAKLWDQEQKMHVLSVLCEGGDPVELFTIPRVRTFDPDNPDPDKDLLGHLIFTNKAVCFAQIAELKKPTQGVESGVLFGALGAAVEAAIKEKQSKSTMNKIWAEAEEAKEIKGPCNLRGVLEKADRLIVFPKETITDIGYSRFGRFKLKIKTSSKSHPFNLEGNQAKTYKRFEPKIKDYLSH